MFPNSVSLIAYVDFCFKMEVNSLTSVSPYFQISFYFRSNDNE
jgi:hypothetical protein